MRIRNQLFRHTALLTVLSLFLSGCVTGSMVTHYRGPEGYEYSPKGQGSIFLESEAFPPSFCVRTEDMEQGSCLMIKEYDKRAEQFRSIFSGRSKLKIKKVDVMMYPEGEGLMAYLKASYLREQGSIASDPKGEIVDIYAGPFSTEPFDMNEAELVEAGPHGFEVTVGIADKAEQTDKATAKALATAPMTLFVDGVIVVTSFFIFILFLMGGG
jgi:hypothetical protein